MYLSDNDIIDAIENKLLCIEPWDPSRLQPASYDLALSDEFLVLDDSPMTTAVLDPEVNQSHLFKKVVATKRTGFELKPGAFVLGCTVERLTVSTSLVCRIEGKSSLGRLGLIIHSTAGFIDPGWKDGTITLEFSNLTQFPIILRPGMKICQVSYAYLKTMAMHGYGDHSLRSKYQGQDGPTASRMHENY